MSWRHLSDTTPVARKPHRCGVCEREIPVGEKHVARRGVDEDERRAVTFRMHQRCAEITSDWDEGEWEYFDPSNIRQILDKEAEKGTK